MNTLKGWITTFVLITTLMVSTTFANDGIIIAGVSKEPTPSQCTEESKGDEKSGIGIIIAGIGIIIAGFAGTGIIIAGATEEPPVNCGIIIAG